MKQFIIPDIVLFVNGIPLAVEVDKVMPDYRERKEWLKTNGAGLAL